MFRVDHLRGQDATRACPNYHYVLSQVHLDHAKLSYRFPCRTWTSAITRWLMSETLADTSAAIDFHTLRLNQWNALDSTTRIFVFDSGHCMGSIGFYAPKE